MAIAFVSRSSPSLLAFSALQSSSSPATLSFRRSNYLVAASMTDDKSYKLPHVLTVAGSDSGAGAGIQADIKACGAMGVYCSSVLTAVTAQNTAGVQGVHLIPENFVEEQLESVLSDMAVDVIKTGMLPSVGVIKILCKTLKRYPIKALVVDPVMVSTSGDTLSAPSTLSGYRDDLFRMADIVTPNIKEASALLGGLQLETISDMHHAAESIHKFGPKNVLVKGGHMPGSSDAVDIFFDGEKCYEIRGPHINTHNTHGTGCTLAACIASELAKGSKMLQAVQVAKAFVARALDNSKNLTMGNGPQGPFDHLFALKKNIPCNIGPSLRFKDEDLFLYAVTDSGMNRKWGRSMTDAVKAAIQGGATIVQLREKEIETREFIETAKACIEICRPHKIPVIINDRVDVALASDSDGVHLGQSDMWAHTARSLLGPNKIIGVSCKTPAQVDQAWMDGADYVGSGGVYETNTKKGNVTIGVEGLKRVCLGAKLPVVAIGGVGAGNVDLVFGIGEGMLKGVAVVSALFDKEDVEGETSKLRAVLDRLKSNQ